MAEKQLRDKRKLFVNGASEPLLKDLLDELLQNKVINEGEKEEVMERYPVKRDKAREVIDMVMRKGENASKIMIDLLNELDHELFKKMGLVLTTEQPRGNQDQVAEQMELDGHIW